MKGSLVWWFTLALFVVVVVVVIIVVVVVIVIFIHVWLSLNNKLPEQENSEASWFQNPKQTLKSSSLLVCDNQGIQNLGRAPGLELTKSVAPSSHLQRASGSNSLQDVTLSKAWSSQT